MDDTETKQRIEETVRRILQESDMDEVTESKIRKQASEQLGLNLSQPHFKAFVKQVVGAFLQEKLQEQEENDEKEDEEEQGVSKGKEYDDEGDLIICKVCFVFLSSEPLLVILQVAMPQINFVFGFQLSEKRRVTIQDFRGKTLVSIREYYKKDGKDLPTSKGCLCYLFRLSFFSILLIPLVKEFRFWIEGGLKVWIFLVLFEIGGGWRFCFNFFIHVKIPFVNFKLN